MNRNGTATQRQRSNGSRLPENEHSADAAASAVDNAGDLTSDLVTLLELQAHLLRIDVGVASEKAWTPVGLGVLAIGLIVGACPLALLGIAWAIADATTLSVAGSALIVAAVAAALAVLLGWIAWKKFGSCVDVLSRSREEFVKSLNWFKGILRRRR